MVNPLLSLLLIQSFSEYTTESRANETPLGGNACDFSLWTIHVTHNC
jgi:hypothetical protein